MFSKLALEMGSGPLAKLCYFQYGYFWKANDNERQQIFVQKSLLSWKSNRRQHEMQPLSILTSFESI